MQGGTDISALGIDKYWQTHSLVSRSCTLGILGSRVLTEIPDTSALGLYPACYCILRALLFCIQNLYSGRIVFNF